MSTDGPYIATSPPVPPPGLPPLEELAAEARALVGDLRACRRSLNELHELHAHARAATDQLCKPHRVEHTAAGVVCSACQKPVKLEADAWVHA